MTYIWSHISYIIIGLDEMRALYDYMNKNPTLQLQLLPIVGPCREAAIFRVIAT